MHSASAAQPVDADKTVSTYELVERISSLMLEWSKPVTFLIWILMVVFTFCRGNYKGVTKHLDKKDHPEWNVVFAFSRDRLQASVLEVKVKDKDLVKDDFVGIVRFDLHDVPSRIPPDSPLAPQWYRLENKKGDKVKGELMLVVWLGTQADEAYSEAWHSDTPGIDSDSSAHLRSKVYHSPTLRYVRVNVIEAQDLVPIENNRFPKVFCKAHIGQQIMRTKSVHARTLKSLWNEDLLFVAAEQWRSQKICFGGLYNVVSKKINQKNSKTIIWRLEP